MTRRYDRHSRAVACAAVRACVREGERIDRIRYLARGGTYAAYLVEVLHGPDCDELRQVVARVPRYPLDVEAQRAARQEVRILGQLARERLPFRIPVVMGHEEIDGRLVMVQEACHGMVLPDRREGRSDPLATLAGIAAAVHAVDVRSWPDGVFDEQPSRRAHVQGLRERAAGGAPSAFDEALGYVDDHLPEDVPGALLHGDLLPQNVRENPGERPAVLDWSLAGCGDPAFDLAVLLRGVRRPFGEPEGRARVLEVYNRAAPEPLTSSAVYVQELLRRMIGYGHLARSGCSEAHCAQEADIVRGILRRARAAAR